MVLLIWERRALIASHTFTLGSRMWEMYMTHSDPPRRLFNTQWPLTSHASVTPTLSCTGAPPLCVKRNCKSSFALQTPWVCATAHGIVDKVAKGHHSAL